MSLAFAAVSPLAGPRVTLASDVREPARPFAVSSSSAGSSSSSALAAAAASATGAAAVAGRRGQKPRQRCRRDAVKQAEAAVLPKVDRESTKEFRRDLKKSDQYHKFGKTQMENAMKELTSTSGSDLVTKMRQNGFRLTIGDVTFVLAESYGFCWGVERAVAMAYEARNFFPDKNIWVTNEIIHNPLVNEKLSSMGMRFVQKKEDGSKDFSGVQPGDVVILPAFGASIDEMAFLKERKVQIVDTTCPWVSKVWTSVEKSKDKGHTAIIHGKYDHEETIATKSFAKKYLVVKNLTEAEYVAQYILGKIEKEEFMAKFAKAMPEDFDPDVDLEKVGVANQTTMLKGETELIGKLFERVMIKRYGPQEIDNHFVSFNTICDATQERQDAMYKMFDAQYEAPSSQLYADLEGEQVGVNLRSTKNQERLSSKAMEDEKYGAKGTEAAEMPQKVEVVVVVGGFNSSNTTHLLEIAEEEHVPGYHIDCAERIGRGESANSIEHKPLSTPPAEAMMDQGLKIDEKFLKDGPVVVGLTSGASTPDNVVGEVMDKIISLKGAH